MLPKLTMHDLGICLRKTILAFCPKDLLTLQEKKVLIEVI